MKKIATLLLCLLATTSLQAAAGPELKAKAAACMACHGENGISNNDMWPNLAGQKKSYLIKQIEAFRKGTRVDVMMNPIVKPLTEEDIDAIATYYSSL